MNDMDLLRKAYERENDTRLSNMPFAHSWTFYNLGATRADVRRLLDDGLCYAVSKVDGLGTRYMLTDKGRNAVWPATMEAEFERVPAASVMEAMSLLVGWDDLKEEIARTINLQRRSHFLLIGPPACGKSVILEAVRSSVPGAYLAFGSRTSAAGLSDALFEHRPRMLLLDEADKMRNDVFSILLGLMESGDVIDTKCRQSRGIRLETTVFAACNTAAKMPREFRSRFDMQVNFPPYTRAEFLDVCRGYLARAENCPEDLATLIGEQVFDNQMGDFRRARAVWKFMTAPTREEVVRVVKFMLKYRPQDPSDVHKRRPTQPVQPVLI